jgi:hypothetical protein
VVKELKSVGANILWKQRIQQKQKRAAGGAMQFSTHTSNQFGTDIKQAVPRNGILSTSSRDKPYKRGPAQNGQGENATWWGKTRRERE